MENTQENGQHFLVNILCYHMILIDLDLSTWYVCILVDYSIVHRCDHVIDGEPGLFHLAAEPLLVVLEQTDDVDLDVFV